MQRGTVSCERRFGMEVAMRRRTIVWLSGGMLVLALTGCAKNPEKSVVREKNMEKMLEAAENDENSSTYEQLQKEKFDKYQTQIKDQKRKVTVNVDAKVEIPEAEKLSVYRVSAKKIRQKFLDQVIEALSPGAAYYDGSKKEGRTKAVIAKEIKEWERYLQEAEENGDSQMVKEYKENIAEAKKEYKKAPEAVRLTDYPSDKKIQRIGPLYEKAPEDTFYKWLYELHGNGDVFYGVSDGSDSVFRSLFMQNSENYGNCLRYESGRNDCAYNIYHADVGDDIEMLVPKEEGKEPDLKKAGMEFEAELKPVTDEPLTISEEDAWEKAEALLNQLELKDYQCYDKGMYSQIVGKLDAGEEVKYRDVYRFLCLRKLDGVFVNNQAGFKLMDEWQGSSYVKKMWGSEAVAVAVNDSGIVSFHCLSPISIDETVVKKTRIKSFEEIRDTFEQMVVIENTPEEKEAGSVVIKVTDVRLVYTRISEKNSFDTGLVVPVWDFEGTITDEYGNEKTGNILSVNAIDGSVINRELGY